jgi:hypothetical protein
VAGGGRNGIAGRTGLHILTDWSDFEKLRKPWNELAEVSGAGLFVSHDWLSAWIRVYGERFVPRVLQVWRDGTMVAAAPCGVTQHKLRGLPFAPKVKCLSALSNDETPFSRFLVAPGHSDALLNILELVAGGLLGCDMCEFRPYPDGEGRLVLHDCATDIGLITSWTETGSSVTVDISSGWEDYLAAKSKSSRKRIRRERRALEAVEHSWIRGTGTEEGLLDRVFDVSLKSWKGRAGTSIASTESQKDLYRDLCRRFGPKGAMELNLLEINGADAGCLVAIRHGEKIYGMKIDFDESYAAYSPGRVMAADLLERAAASGAREVDMLRRSRFTGEFSADGYGLGRLQLFHRRNLPALWYGMQERLRPIGREWRRRRRRARGGREAHARKE